ncbi:glyoxalase/bleomycin resistance/extradiol dioxygenase family protein [Panacibacter sp. DH6]|uniref:Glyoxalase/bleomycin resistance/extradiol dioxygenase family protein n=1 Tax=Panacibacter microcysteis TaxID=2793269 RepID=A0A931EBP4_9BACT|nr:glyoxalase/bleomycin resistance/extradiol dioxygenase family protein [Panacibacter microcysteis]MBG9377686.1 glyoxalase/bleomycin resistance/extradiol dioxygenase family protein [Panacibacter microcysteis]
MSRQIFINLAVKDVERSMAFYTAMGFTNNPQFSDESGKCMVWSDSIFVMILSHEKFATFATKPIADTKAALAALYSLSTDSVEAMNTIVEAGLQAGGTEPHALRDYGFMQQRTLEDFDGHSWEIFFMDMSKFPAGEPVAQ